MENKGFYDLECRFHTYESIIKAMNGEAFDMSLTGEDIEIIENAVNQGIDSHLEACFIEGQDNYEHGSRHGFVATLESSVSPESMPILLRRLFESENEQAEMLASDILSIILEEC